MKLFPASPISPTRLARTAFIFSATALLCVTPVLLHAQSSSSSAGSSGGTRSPSTFTTSPTPSPRPAAQAKPSSSYNQASSTSSSPAANSAANVPAPASGAQQMSTDPAYKLAIGDEIAIDVHGEGDMSTAQRIDQQGNVRIPYVNDVSLANKTVREAETYLEKLYVERKLLKKPLVNINVRDYSSRQVTIIGAVNAPGIFRFPRDADSIEIVDLITSQGGFRPTAKSDSVRVTRTEEGRDRTINVDVEAMIYNRRNALKSFKIFPGDRILVTERIW